MNGLVPTNGVADLTVDVDSFPVGNVVELLQSDVAANGTFALHGNVRGTSSQPTFAGRFNLTGAEYNDAPFPDLLGRLSYADERLVTHIDAQHGAGPPLMTVDARLPLNLAFTGVQGDRVLAEPVSIDVVGDSLPVELIPDVTDLVTDVHGRAARTIRGARHAQGSTVVGIGRARPRHDDDRVHRRDDRQHRRHDSHGRRQRLRRLARRQTRWARCGSPAR